jgi:FkbM family methyltransferase
LTLNGVPRLYLNECANDLWIRQIVFPDRRNGYFVEAGAADGVSGSSCYLLEAHYGWRGVCIEPNGALFDRLRRTRPNSIHENVCLAAESGHADFVEAVGRSPLLSGVRQVLERYKSDAGEVLANGNTVCKPAATLAELLRTHQAPAVIEYGAFDIEGSELEALRSFPFDEYRFLAISLELDGAIAAETTRLLTGKGYREVQNPFNTAFPWEHYFLAEELRI